MFAQIDFTYNKIKQGNRNPLLYKNIGVDGLKTGHTEIGGYGIVATAKQHGRRLLLVANGFKTMNERSRASQSLLEWGYREFDNVLMTQKGQIVEEVPVANGVQDKVGLLARHDVLVTLSRNIKPQVKVSLVYKKPLIAPLSVAQPVAHLVVQAPNRPDLEIALYPAQDVKKAGFVHRMISSIKRLVFGAENAEVASSVPTSAIAPLQPAAQPIVPQTTTAPALIRSSGQGS